MAVALLVGQCQFKTMALHIHRILHAGYLFTAGDFRLLIDPIFESPFSNNCFAYPDVKFDLAMIAQLKFSAVVISHFHDDHCSFESLRHLDRATPIYIFCRFEKMHLLLKELGFRNVQGLQLNLPVELGPFQITARRAVQSDVDSILQIEIEDLNILNVVDSEIDRPTLALLKSERPWDLILWPFQIMRETEVLDPRRAQDLPVRDILREMAAQIKILSPRILVPSSCQFQMEAGSWYNQSFFAVSYQEFSSAVMENLLQPGPSIVRMNPGVGYQLSSQAFVRLPNLEWAQGIGEQDLDYTYSPNFKAPPTSELARRWPALTETQRQALEEYLTVTLPLRYCEIGPPAGLYFNRTVRWELRTYDQLGQARSHWYEVREDQMKLRPAPMPIISPILVEATRPRTESTTAEWRTDISEYKLLSAVENGEALNSIYLRVNDCEFDHQIEEKLKSADVMMDPLIRCLYDGAFGSYQESQLRRIRERDQ